MCSVASPRIGESSRDPRDERDRQGQIEARGDVDHGDNAGEQARDQACGDDHDDGGERQAVPQSGFEQAVSGLFDA